MKIDIAKGKVTEETKATDTIKFEIEYRGNCWSGCGSSVCNSNFEWYGVSKKRRSQNHYEIKFTQIIQVSQLSTYECVYNDVCTVMDEKDSTKKAYYCKYKGRVKAGIDFSKVDIKITEQEEGESLITITLPEVTLNEPDVDISSLKCMFLENSAEDGTVSGEAYNACIQDAKEKSQSEKLIYETAQDNAVNIVKGLVEPFVRNAEMKSGYHYTVKITTAKEYTK